MSDAAETTTPAGHAGLRICVFELAGQSFGLPLESISEIVPMAALSRPPSTPPILEGFLNLRGTALPVLRVAALLGLPQDALDLHTPLVILRGGQLPLALLVDRVTGIVAVPSDGVLPIAESDSFNGCVGGRLTAAEHSAVVLSLDKLLLEKERQVLAHFQAEETQRLGRISQELS